MFSSVGWGEVLVLVVVALVVLGPERLPGAISWVMGSLKKVRDYANGASNELQEQLGTDFDSIREPLQQLNELRGMTPKAMITKHLFDGDSSTMDSLENSVRGAVDIDPFGPSQPVTSRPTSVSDGATQADPSRLDGGVAAPHTPAPATPARKHDVTDWDAT
ncbi:MAG: Sec-independent protein translocase protein TatB [Gordonia sp. (in: high G+C Gram-positive bacteria)]|uniref:Sec-independent protein translocase protein TatB n=1 Tax=Gordonia sp. (in: high G+C Gram-positive bacteria) TaxID=84139 RepID=UPI0039E55184